MKWVCEESLKNPLLATNFIIFWFQKQAFTHYWHLHGPSLAQQINCDKILFSHTRRWYKFLFLNYFFIFLFFSFLFLLFYVILLLLVFTKIILLLLFYFYFFFHENYFYFFMFRDIPGCSGMFRVPGFIDALCSRKIDDFRKNFDLSWHCVGRLTRPERNLRNLFRGHSLKYINCSNKSIIYIGFLMNNNSKNILFRYYVC